MSRLGYRFYRLVQTSKLRIVTGAGCHLQCYCSTSARNHNSQWAGKMRGHRRGVGGLYGHVAWAIQNEGGCAQGLSDLPLAGSQGG